MTLVRAVGSRPCLTFSSNGKYLAFVAADGSPARLDMSGQDPRPVALGSLPTPPTSLAFTNDGVLVAGDSDGRLFALEGTLGRVTEAAERGHPGRITCLAVSPDQTLCATGADDASIVLWDRRTLRVRARMQGQNQPTDALAFTVDGKTLVSAVGRIGVQFWNVATGQPTMSFHEIMGRPSLPDRLGVAADGSSIAVLVNSGPDAEGVIWHAARPGPE